LETDLGIFRLQRILNFAALHISQVQRRDRWILGYRRRNSLHDRARFGLSRAGCSGSQDYAQEGEACHDVTTPRGSSFKATHLASPKAPNRKRRCDEAGSLDLFARL
jgi:hypothetical protein